MILSVLLGALLCHMALGTAGPCPAGFSQEVFDGNCYYFAVTTANYDTAKSTCEEKGADLVTLETEAEFKYLKGKLSGGSHYTSAVRVVKGFYWNTRDHIASDHYGWNEGEPNNVGGNENCVEMKQDKYFLNDAVCSLKNAYICELFEDCPTDWVKDPNGDGCYYIHDAADKTWTEANAACADKGAALASFVQVRSRFRFLRATLRKLKVLYSFWVSGHLASFQYSTGLSLSAAFPGWYNNEPNNAGGSENCVEFREGFQYDLNDIPCSIVQKYVCEQKAACPTGYIYNADAARCYLFTDGSIKKNMPDAQKHCEALGADVISMESEHEYTFVNDYLKGEGKTLLYWTSATRVTSGFYWASGVKATVAWYSGEPNDSGGVEDCIEMRSSMDFKHNDLNCNTKIQYVCEMPIDSCVSCIPNADTNSCYHFSSGPDVTWKEAEHQCHAMNGELVSIETAEEFTFIQDHIKANEGSKSRWTSGRRTDFIWGSGEPLPNGHVGWHAVEPNDYKGIEDCVEVRSDRLMNDLPCTYTRAVVCEVDAA